MKVVYLKGSMKQKEHFYIHQILKKMFNSHSLFLRTEVIAFL